MKQGWRLGRNLSRQYYKVYKTLNNMENLLVQAKFFCLGEWSTEIIHSLRNF